MPARTALFLSLLCSAAPARATPNRLRVSMPDDLRCPAPFDVVAALQRRFGADRVAEGRPERDEMGLSIAAFPDAIELAMSEGPGQRPARRRLPLAEGGCADLAETISLLADAWVRELPWHGAGFLPDIPPGPPPPPPAPRPETSAPSARRILGPLTLRLAGGGVLAIDGSSLSPQGALTAELGLFRHFGAALFGSVQSDLSAVDSDSRPNLVTVHRQTLALAARYALVDQTESGFRFYAGAELERFGADTTGYSFSSAASSTTYNPALLLAALWQQNVWGRLSLFAQFAATLAPPLAFQVTESSESSATTILQLPPVFLELTAGVAVRLF